MILIADSGSTKTSWALIRDDHSLVRFQSSGFNPYVQKEDEISMIIKDEVFPEVKDSKIDKICFYGAGCSTAENKSFMYNCFKAYFKDSKIEIEHDLIAAARAL